MAGAVIGPEFVGNPVGKHGSCTFYSGFRYTRKDVSRVLSVGEFMFVRISPDDDPCIGELQLVWDDRQSDQQLSSVRLYFLPEQTPEGRLPHQGEHEALATEEKAVLRLEDLISWITDEVEWTHGLLAECGGEDAPDQQPEEVSESVPEKQNGPAKEEPSEDETATKETEPHGALENCLNGLGVVVLSYPRYCRYRAMLRRLAGCEGPWLRHALVLALGGLPLKKGTFRVLFCRDTFDHEGLQHNDLICDHLAPTFKGKHKKKSNKQRGRSPGSESNTSEESKDNLKVQLENRRNGVNKGIQKEEEQFLQRLFKFMKERSTPIQRVPHLGFKQIDLYDFYINAQKLGGYEKVTYKKQWKKVYDQLGGSPGSTSAATCTRRHYERLLLPFERHLRGEDSKPLPPPPPPRMKKKGKSKDGEENGDGDSDESSASSTDNKPLKSEPESGNSSVSSNDVPLDPSDKDIAKNVDLIVKQRVTQLMKQEGEKELSYRSHQNKKAKQTKPSKSPSSGNPPLTLHIKLPPSSQSSRSSLKSSKSKESKKHSSPSPISLPVQRLAQSSVTDRASPKSEIKLDPEVKNHLIAASLPDIKPNSSLYSVPNMPRLPSPAKTLSIPVTSIKKEPIDTKPLDISNRLLGSAPLLYQKPMPVFHPNHPMSSAPTSGYCARLTAPQSVNMRHDSKDWKVAAGLKDSSMSPSMRPSVIRHTEKTRTPPLSAVFFSDSNALYNRTSPAVAHSVPSHFSPLAGTQSSNRVPAHSSDHHKQKRSSDAGYDARRNYEPREHLLVNGRMVQKRAEGTCNTIPLQYMQSMAMEAGKLLSSSRSGLLKHSSEKSDPPHIVPVSPVSTPSPPSSPFHSKHSSYSHYNSEVLDLSVKKRPVESAPKQSSSSSVSVSDSGECLDLSVKRRRRDNSPSVVPLALNTKTTHHQHLPSTLQQSKAHVSSASMQNKMYDNYSNGRIKTEVQKPKIPHLIPFSEMKTPLSLPRELSSSSTSSLSSGNSSSKASSSISSMSKSPVVSDYNPQLPTFLTPPMFHFNPAGWTAATQGQAVRSSSQSAQHANLTAYKELIERGGIFPGQLSYPLAQQFYQLMYKDNHV